MASLAGGLCWPAVQDGWPLADGRRAVLVRRMSAAVVRDRRDDLPPHTHSPHGLVRGCVALLRRAALSVAVPWIQRARPRRNATTTGFFDAMSACQQRKAFSLVTARHSSALATS